MSVVTQTDDQQPLPDIVFTITITAKPSTGELKFPIPPQALSALGIHPDTEVEVDFDDDTDPAKPILTVKRV